MYIVLLYNTPGKALNKIIKSLRKWFYIFTFLMQYN